MLAPWLLLPKLIQVQFHRGKFDKGQEEMLVVDS
jgi:hypothetical protein